MIGKIFEREMLSRILPTSLLQKFSKNNLDYQVIVKSNDDPDENFSLNSEALMG